MLGLKFNHVSKREPWWCNFFSMSFLLGWCSYPPLTSWQNSVIAPRGKLWDVITSLCTDIRWFMLVKMTICCAGGYSHFRWFVMTFTINGDVFFYDSLTYLHLSTIFGKTMISVYIASVTVWGTHILYFIIKMTYLVAGIHLYIVGKITTYIILVTCGPGIVYELHRPLYVLLVLVTTKCRQATFPKYI